MYRWIFRRLPGPTWVRIVSLAIIGAAVTWVLFDQVFPWAEPFVNQPTSP
ncbi:MAG: hypothetical protein WCJ22_00465 [Actinomycetes bacterium]|jgi:hypothetical protein